MVGSWSEVGRKLVGSCLKFAEVRLKMTAHEGRSVDPRLIENDQRRNDTQYAIYISVSEN